LISATKITEFLAGRALERTHLRYNFASICRLCLGYQ